jgi:hypothetical protein
MWTNKSAGIGQEKALEDRYSTWRLRTLPRLGGSGPAGEGTMEPFDWNYKPVEKYCWLIFCERKILFRLKKQAE